MFFPLCLSSGFKKSNILIFISQSGDQLPAVIRATRYWTAFNVRQRADCVFCLKSEQIF